jgi:LPXTG-site transpeptidase (sortase) family protein
MASGSASRALGLLLAVVAAITVVIAASRRTGSTTATPPGAPADGATAAAHGAGRPGGAPHTGALPSTAQPRRPAAPGRSSAGSRSATGGKASPAAPMNVTVDSPQGGLILSAPVDPMAAQHDPDGSWAPITPPSLTRAVWMTQSAMPAAPSSGTTAIYGHACIGLTCAFNSVANTPTGSTVTVHTSTAILRYRVVSMTQYPKVGAQSLGSRRDAANQLLLITCAYHPDGSSTNNLVLIATLVGTARR